MSVAVTWSVWYITMILVLNLTALKSLFILLLLVSVLLL